MTAEHNTSARKAAGTSVPSRLAATLALDKPVQSVKAISGARQASLAKLGIKTVRDLVTHFPRRYIDMSRVTTAADAQINDTCTVVGSVYDIKLKQTRKKWLSIVEITLVDQTGTLMVTCFRQPWLMDHVHKGDWLQASGKVEFNYGFKRMTNPYLEAVDPASPNGGVILAVHPASEKVPAKLMRTLVGNALDTVCGLDDPLPARLRIRYDFYSRGSALRCIHFPHTMEEAAQARRRLTYEEVLLLELHLMLAAEKRGRGYAPCAHTVDGPHVAALETALPFDLTDEQARARDELFAAMAAPRPANHMLLGDVGTGKTAVAAFGLAAAADSGGQALMMAPTEVLAQQYARKLGPLLDAAGVTWALLTGTTDMSDRTRICAGLADGSLSVLFGTHALLEPDVRPARCTFVVIDEQQRFGVAQREKLVAKGVCADVLAMTATPIPRSLALALYGDMTLSYLRHRPLERMPTVTHVFPFAQRGAAYELVRNELEAGRQAYVVCPLVGTAAPKPKKADKGASDDDYAYANIAIEDAGDMAAGGDARAAIDEARFLQNKIFPGFEVGVLHGKMKAEEKREVMDRFVAGEIRVLVATTVIEVGVDVPNATAMVVEDADRFGLAQLHQLRGRVGRGEHPGVVCLVSASKAPAALERLAAMERTNDGFELAEFDLSLRREGDILGNRQSGASVLKLVNVVRDKEVIEAAHEDARRLLEADPNLSDPAHQALRYEMVRMFGPIEGE